LTENFRILATDDEKIKSFGEILTNDSSREILQLLFDAELSATQIAQKSNISLQLVKYHLAKLQSLDIVKISKIEKNSKSQDMKIYTALKFSIVIVPPTLSEKTKESKSLVRSFRHIYKVAGLGVATGISGIFSLSQISRDKAIVTDNTSSREFNLPAASDQTSESSKHLSDESVVSLSGSESLPQSSSVMDDVSSRDLDSDTLKMADVAIVSNDVLFSPSELFVPFAMISVALGGLTAYYLYKFFKKS
jgi:hypothetical protein